MTVFFVCAGILGLLTVVLGMKVARLRGSKRVSLGDGGTVVLTFPQPIGDVPGPDFAVFENGFKAFDNSFFLELAHVEVSSDGVNFYRFPSSSLTPSLSQ